MGTKSRTRIILAKILSVLSILLGVCAVLWEYSSGDNLFGGALRSRVSSGQLLLLAAAIAMTANLVRFYLRGETRKLVARDARVFFWLSGLVILGLSIALVVITGKKLSDEDIIEQFYKVYYTSERISTRFLGIESWQYPTDNWIMQEMITEIRPDFIIETGTNAGGTALFYATVLEKLGNEGRVITVDIADYDPRVLKFSTWNERVEYIRGSSVSPEVLEKIRARVKGRKVLVTLDSLHDKAHVLKEINLYSDLVSLNSYVVVQDTQLMGHPIPLTMYSREGKEGPWEAVQEFIASDNRFVIDRSRERFLLTAAPSGFLKRIK